MTPFDVKRLTSHLMAIVTFALSLTICEIFAKLIECNEGQGQDQGQGGEKRDLRHSTRNVLFHTGDFSEL